MSIPIISTTTTLMLRNAALSGGRYAIITGDLAVLRFSVDSSGIDSPYVKHRIEWGDGDFDVSGDFLPTGREFQYTHEYKEIGEYTITVKVTNKDGETSVTDSFAVVSIRVDPLPARQQRPFKWRGLALPISSIKTALAAIEQSFPVEVLPLSIQAAAGQRQLVFATDDLAFAENAEVTITQDDKLITAGRIITTNLNIATLDTDLNDTYDPGRVRVEIARRDISRRYSSIAFKQPDWYYPITTDEELVKSAVSMILATRPGERVFRPDIGSRIHELPFEQNDSITQAQARGYVPDEIREQEPRAQVRKVIIDSPADSELWVRTELDLAVGEDTTFNVSVPLRGSSTTPSVTPQSSSL